MSIRVALNHKTRYVYDRPITLGPHLVRLRPAPHCRTPIASYSLTVRPEEHFINWQQDPHGNFMARCVFPEKTTELLVEVDLVAEMTVINPFDFFVEESADRFPFKYEPWLADELKPFLVAEPVGPLLAEMLASLKGRKEQTVTFLVAANQVVQSAVSYLIRMEPGVQTPEDTLKIGSGSCRDSAWLFVQLVRNLGLAARFVSGYLIQLAPDQRPLDGPAGPAADFTDLHAWAEVFVPGAGWIGLDPTSGLLAGEGHIPLAATPSPAGAAPITGVMGKCKSELEFAMTVTRIHEDPRVTKPYTDEQWARIDAVGAVVDKRLESGDVRLTIGGEPTFVSIDDMDGPEWTSEAVSPTKRRLSIELLHRLRARFAPGALLHYGQGKWYPGEPLPRWALSALWRTDGEPIWHDPSLVAEESRDYGHTPEDAERFTTTLARVLDVQTPWVAAAYEDTALCLLQEQRLPPGVDPTDPKLADSVERAGLARAFERGLGTPTGYVMPLQRQLLQGRASWMSATWALRSEHLYLLPGDSPLGLRLPLASIGEGGKEYPLHERDPLDCDGELPSFPKPTLRASDSDAALGRAIKKRLAVAGRGPVSTRKSVASPYAVGTAVCVEPREGRLHVFLPPVETLEDFLDLVSAVEHTAAATETPVIVEGYLPPNDPRAKLLKVTPDPGVIEVNVAPAASWRELVENTTTHYEEARLTRLGTEKFDLDGKHTGTGGGNHVVLGGATPADSPFLRRPDLLRSILGCWNNHPSLSYLFSGKFIGPTSQAPRVDEGRRDALYELETAFALLPPRDEECPLWLVDRLFRNLLVDLTGNTHRAEVCIDKLYSPDSATGRLGLVELRGFEMPPHARMSLTQQLLIRAIVVKYWEKPWQERLVAWGTSLHDRFMLPHFVWQDFCDVVEELRGDKFAIESEWYRPHFEFRFPKIGEIACNGLDVELRAAIEPWYVLGEEPAGGGTVRFVDSSVERLQVRVAGLTDTRHVVTCNGRRLPLVPTGTVGEYVAGVRYRAWQPVACLQPTIPVHTPLVIDVVDTWAGRSVGGCTYHVAHPAGRNYETLPVNPFEAEARRVARFFASGHTPGPVKLTEAPRNAWFPATLDLRRSA